MHEVTASPSAAGRGPRKVAKEATRRKEQPNSCQCTICSEEYLSSLGRGAFKFANNDLYIGESSRDCKHGYGLYLHQKGDAYAGEFRHNERHGLGNYINWDGCYHGYWVGGMRSGVGIQTQRDGSRQISQWRNNRKHGPGALVYASGQIYCGVWVNNSCEFRELLFQSYEPSELVTKYLKLDDVYLKRARAQESSDFFGLTDWIKGQKGNEEEALVNGWSAMRRSPPREDGMIDSTHASSDEDDTFTGGQFESQLNVLRYYSSVAGCRHWSASMLAYFLSYCGISKRSITSFVKNDIRGSNICDVLSGRSFLETFLDIGLDKIDMVHIKNVLCIMLKLE